MCAMTRSVAIVGVGNSLLSDDGAGIHALNVFAEQNTDDDVDCIDGGTVGLGLLDRLGGLQGLIALDAMILGKPPGSVTVLEGEDMDLHLRRQRGSVHELGSPIFLMRCGCAANCLRTAPWLASNLPIWTGARNRRMSSRPPCPRHLPACRSWSAVGGPKPAPRRLAHEFA